MIKFSLGYFLYDTYEILVKRPFSKYVNFTLLNFNSLKLAYFSVLTAFFVVHHSLCITCLTTTLTARHLVSMNLVGLIMETNSIFVALRLLTIYSKKTETAFFQVLISPRNILNRNLSENNIEKKSKFTHISYEANPTNVAWIPISDFHNQIGFYREF